MDGAEDDTLRMCTHLLYVNSENLELIRAQSARLASFAESLSTWNNCPYARCIRLVNSETAENLRRVWTFYSSDTHMTPSFLANYSKDIQKTRDENEYFEIDPLQSARESFWIMGGVGVELINPGLKGITKCNPLFAYSDIGGARFAVHRDSNPYGGFHPASAFAKLPRNYNRFHPRAHGQNDDGSTNYGVRALIGNQLLQLENSCESFQRLVKSNPERLRIRVFTGDAISFCMGLR